MKSKNGLFRVIFASSVLGFGALAFACGSSQSGDSNGDGDGGESAGGTTGRGGSSNGGSTSQGGSTSGGGGSATGGASGSTGSGGTAGADWCGDRPCACSNGLDDDGDGLVDGLDPECTGPLDNDEGSFSTGIPGDNRDPKWQDCFFDGNSGAGDDGCRYHTDCMYGTRSSDDPDCAASQQCIDFCRRLVPNGCDCFGCCTVQTPEGEKYDIVIGESCSLENLDDEDACRPCTKSVDCNNDCGECELCPGKTLEDLPESCREVPDGGTTDGGTYDGGTPPPGNTCDEGQIVCSADIPCEGSYYCSLGCCLPVVR